MKLITRLICLLVIILVVYCFIDALGLINNDPEIVEDVINITLSEDNIIF